MVVRNVSPLRQPAVLTASPTLRNFLLISFCLVSGNSFPKCTWHFGMGLGHSRDFYPVTLVHAPGGRRRRAPQGWRTESWRGHRGRVWSGPKQRHKAAVDRERRSYGDDGELGSLLLLSHCDPENCSPPGSSVHGIFQARILEWVAISFSRGSSWPRDRTQVSLIVGRRFTVWATREVC